MCSAQAWFKKQIVGVKNFLTRRSQRCDNALVLLVAGAVRVACIVIVADCAVCAIVALSLLCCYS